MTTFNYWDGDTHIYIETMPNGDELVSEYGTSYQKAYVRTKEMLDTMRDEHDIDGDLDIVEVK